MTTPELDGRNRGWAEVLTPVLNDLTIVSWADNKLSEYKGLPKGNIQERKKSKKFSCANSRSTFAKSTKYRNRS